MFALLCNNLYEAKVDDLWSTYRSSWESIHHFYVSEVAVITAADLI